MGEYQPDAVYGMECAHADYEHQYQVSHRCLRQLQHSGPCIGSLSKGAGFVDVATKYTSNPTPVSLCSQYENLSQPYLPGFSHPIRPSLLFRSAIFFHSVFSLHGSITGKSYGVPCHLGRAIASEIGECVMQIVGIVTCWG